MPFRATGDPRRRGRPAAWASLLVVAAALLTGGCSPEAPAQGSNLDPSQVDATTPPLAGECRMLTPADLRRPTNATATVPCEDPHTAETYAAGELPAAFADTSYDDRSLASFAYTTCGQGFMLFLGADESVAMRSVLSWVMFRPSEAAWDQGARWYRCDAVGGAPASNALLPLPDRAKGLLRKSSDRWLACVKGSSVEEAPRIPCTRPHKFRAVTTIRLGTPEDAYPGDEVVAERTRSFCGDSVAAWLGYPAQYSFGYTWFTQSDWEAGNRRSVCWARTDH